ncbi:MAG TPA: hypothetical protein VMU05_17715 [Dongiaceae bacterium]|nr:hypothetical protein [Dongiaceae bacterium]
MSSTKQEVRLEGRIQMHGNDGYSKIAVLIGGSRWMDFETEKIPPHLRGVGTKVLVIFKQGDERFPGPKGGYHYDTIEVTDFVEGIELGWFPLSE